jgi:hypothetical protein
MARTCLAQTIAAAQALGTTSHDCRTMPILFVGSDAHEAAVHDFNAIFVGETHLNGAPPTSAHPEWISLNR